MDDDQPQVPETDERTRAEIQAVFILALGMWRLGKWRKAQLRSVVVVVAAVMPAVGVLALWVLRDLVTDEPVWDVLMQRQFSTMATYFGGGLLALGAVLQMLAASATFKQRDEVPVVDGFALGGWSTIALGAFLAWAPSLVGAGT